MVSAFPGLKQLAVDLCKGSRAALSRAITLVESTRLDYAAKAEFLMAAVAPVAASRQALRIGVSGHVGAGKSSLIEALGMFALKEMNLSVAVLAIDPSSTVTKGSILGDKTRMTALSSQPRAFIRPSPSSGTLGGLSRRTDESIILCEAAGFDVIFIETVGVGQSESSVADACDFLLLLIAPGAGDALQGLKKGVLDFTDLVVVTKADGNLLKAAMETRRDYAAALSLQQRHRLEFWRSPVILSSISGESGNGGSGSKLSISCNDKFHKHLRDSDVYEPRDIWGIFDEFRGLVNARLGSNGLSMFRAKKRERWMWNEANTAIMSRFRNHSAVLDQFETIRGQVSDGSITARSAAQILVKAYVSTGSEAEDV